MAARHAPEFWWAVGYDLMCGMGVGRAAKKHGTSKRAVEAARERFRETGRMEAAKPTGGAGEVRRAARGTTERQERKVGKLIDKHRGEKLEYTSRMVKKTLKLSKVGRRTVARRANEQMFGRANCTIKEPGSEEDQRLRLAFAKRVEGWTAEDWRKVVYADEHDIVHPVGKSGSRQVHSRKRWTWGKLEAKTTKKGIKKMKLDPKDRYHPKRCKPRGGSNVQGGKHMKLCCAIAGSRAVLIERAQRYIEMRKEPPPKPPRLSKNGLRLGRKPDPDKPKRRKKFDGLAYAEFLPELAAAARKELGIPETETLYCLHDNYGIHWTDECKAAMEKHNMVFFDDFPPRTPWLDMVENLFGAATPELDAWNTKSTPETPEVTLSRFRSVCKRIAKQGGIRNMIASMPRRIKATIEADGGPINEHTSRSMKDMLADGGGAA